MPKKSGAGSPATTTAVHVISYVCEKLFGSDRIQSVKHISIAKGKLTVTFPTDESPSNLKELLQNHVTELIASNISVSSDAVDSSSSSLDENSFPANAGLGDAYTQVKLGDGYARESIGTCVGTLGELHGIKIMKVKGNVKTKLLSVDFQVGADALASLQSASEPAAASNSSGKKKEKSKKGKHPKATGNNQPKSDELKVSHDAPPFTRSPLDICAREILDTLRSQLEDSSLPVSDSQDDLKARAQLTRILNRFQNQCYTLGFSAGKQHLLNKLNS